MLRLALAVLAVSLIAVPSATAGIGMFVGAAEDGAKSLDPVRAKARMDLAALAGVSTVRMTLTWSPRQRSVGGDDRVVLRNVSAAAQLDGVRLMVSIYPADWRTTPLTSRARGEFAEYAASVVRAFPAVRDVIVGNEPNLNRFWMPQFGPGGADAAARSYELLLARTYDALKSVSPDVNVIGGALAPRGQDKPNALRQTHSPTAFITDFGKAYRATHRHRAIMDMFAIHPYVIPSRLPPTFAHPRTTTIGIADYPKLVRLLTTAFRGTAQRGETLPIVYDEFGYQSQIPKRKQPKYTHLRAPGAKDAIPESLQASYYRRAFALAACQPTVAGLLMFHVTDERDARAWQSGLYYSDNTPKSSLAPVRDAALAAQDGTLARCGKSKTTSNLGAVTFHAPAPAPVAAPPAAADPSAAAAPAATAPPPPLTVDFTCALPCSYEAQLIDAATGKAVSEQTGKLLGDGTVTLPTDGLAAGSYQYVLRELKSGKPGTAEVRTSRPFDFAPPDAGDAASPPLDPVPDPDAPHFPPSLEPLPTLLPTVPPPAA